MSRNTKTLPCGRLSTSHIRMAARICSVILLCVIFLGSVYGRTLQRSFPSLISLIPHVAVFILIAGVLLTVRLTKSLYRQRSFAQKTDKKLLLQLLIVTLCAAFGVAAACEALIEFEIERIHFLKYGTFAFLVYFSQSGTLRHKKLLKAAAAGILVGIIEESLQLIIPERFFDWRDILLNIVAALFGTLWAWIMTLWKGLLSKEGTEKDDTTSSRT